MNLKHLRLISLVILILFCLAPVMAQDAEATVEANPVTVVEGEGATTVEDGGVNVVIEAPETPPAPIETPATNVLSISNIISFLIGGVVFAGGVMAYLGAQARAALNDPAKMVIAEKLGDSVPAETANKLIDGLTGILEFLKEATDRQPALLKPSPNSSVSSTGADYHSTTPPMPGR